MSALALLKKPYQAIKGISNNMAANKELERVVRGRLSDARAIASDGNFMDAVNFIYSGEKFDGGWGLDRNYEITNLPEIRRRSLELWRSNPIANAIFGRLETKVINDGLRVEALPEARFIGLTDDSPELQEWTEGIEAFMHLYSIDPSLADERERLNFYQLQRQAYSAAKLSGDCLVIRRIDPETMLPRIQLVDGKHIGTPFEFSMGVNPSTGNDVINGIEVDKKGRELGYWVRVAAFNQNPTNLFNFKSIFISAFGVNSGRRVANLVYGSRLRVDEYRGMPLLGHTMQMLKQIDRTLDNHQLAMALDAALVMSVVKDVKAPQDVEAMLSGGTLRKAATREKTVDVSQPNGSTKATNFKQFGNGIMFDDLPPGTKIESHNSRHPNPNVDKAVLFGMNLASASCEVPPEIMLLMFNNNFSASRQAVNEFDAVRRKEHSQFNPQFNDPVYKDVVIALDINGRQPTPGLMRAMLDDDRITFNAWTQASWSSTAELSVDMLKHINMFEKAHNNGYVTREAVALKYFGTRHKKVVSKLGIENAALAKARAPLVDLEKSNGG